MAQIRPDKAEISSAIDRADAAVARAAATRKQFRRRQTPQRDERLAADRKVCADATEPLRSWLGMAAWGGIDVDDELDIKRVMEALRYERRQIDKMLK